MSTPFEGRPGDHGILTMSREEIHEAVENAHRNDFQIGIHANGDIAIDMVLNAYERVQSLWPRPDPRHRIEHCSLVNPDLLGASKPLALYLRPSIPMSTTMAISGFTMAKKNEMDVRAQIFPRL